MNWKLILQLSLLGLAMGVATMFFIPSSVEPLRFGADESLLAVSNMK